MPPGFLHCCHGNKYKSPDNVRSLILATCKHMTDNAKEAPEANVFPQLTLMQRDKML